MIDVHQHLWPEVFIDRLRARREAPYLDGWTLHTSGEAPYDVDPAAHELDKRVAGVVLFRRDSKGTEYLSERADFFGTEHILAWITEELGEMQLHRLTAWSPQETLIRQLRVAGKMVRV